MPFRKSAKVTISNESKTDGFGLYWYVDWEKRSVPKDVPYFHAQYRQENPPKQGENYLLADIKGRGHYVGTVLSVRMSHPGWFGEGDDRFYVAILSQRFTELVRKIISMMLGRLGNSIVQTMAFRFGKAWLLEEELLLIDGMLRIQFSLTKVSKLQSSIKEIRSTKICLWLMRIRKDVRTCILL